MSGSIAYSNYYASSFYCQTLGRSRLSRRSPATDLRDRIVILVDDGLATGSTMRAAIAAIRQQSPQWMVVAVPVGAPDTCDAIRGEVDEIACFTTQDPLCAIGLWYENFTQTTDEEVCKLLQKNIVRRRPKASMAKKQSLKRGRVASRTVFPNRTFKNGLFQSRLVRCS
ncbi:phosphoribosyltransferase [Altericista sp. CCNU0014]|uniref:phosphoribosyltransferase n=1 Tax=Altericista sp. CCNU0014 TaxID=3082949 RepID=UPI00384F533C